MAFAEPKRSCWMCRLSDECFNGGFQLALQVGGKAAGHDGLIVPACGDRGSGGQVALATNTGAAFIDSVCTIWRQMAPAAAHTAWGNGKVGPRSARPCPPRPSRTAEGPVITPPGPCPPGFDVAHRISTPQATAAQCKPARPGASVTGFGTVECGSRVATAHTLLAGWRRVYQASRHRPPRWCQRHFIPRCSP